MSYDNRFENDSPFEPWNSPMHSDNPFAPWNDPMKRDDPFQPWNTPMAKREDMDKEDREWMERRGIR